MATIEPGGRKRRIARVKALYFESELTVEAIAVATGYSKTGIVQIAGREGWPPHAEVMRERRAAQGTARLGRPCTGLGLCPERAEEVRLAYGAVQAQITALRRAGELAEAAGDVAGAERAARVLAQVVRSLKDLAAIDREGRAASATTGREESGDDDGPRCPRDADALREALARKLDGLRDEYLARGGRTGADGAGDLGP